MQSFFFKFSKEKLWFQQLIWTNNQTYSIFIKISLSNVFSMNSSLPTVNYMYMYIKREDPFLYKWFKLNDSVLNCLIHCFFNICVLFKYTFVWILYKYDSFHMWRKLRALLFPYSVFFNMNGRHAMNTKKCSYKFETYYSEHF